MVKGLSRKLLVEALVTIAVIVALPVLAYYYFTDAFKPAPVLEILPNNTYAETLRVVTDINYEPFSYADETGAYTGLDVELMNEIANRLEMNLDLTLMDWNDANAAVRSGDADIIMNMESDLLTPDSGLIGTLPTTEKQYVVYGQQQVSSVIDLYGKKVASLHQLPQLNLDITYITSYETIFKGLRDGEFDFAVAPIQVSSYFVDKLNMKNVRPSYAVAHVYGVLALPDDPAHDELRARLNVVLKQLSDEGFLTRLDEKWINHRYEYATASSIIAGHPGFAAVLLFGLLLLFALCVLYIMTLQRNTEVRASYTQQLQENLEEIRSVRLKAYIDVLTGVFNKNAYQELAEELQAGIDRGEPEPFAIVVCDVNDLKKVNDAQGHQAGDEIIRAASRIIAQICVHSSVFRIGGDEFVAVLREQDYECRDRLIKRLRARVRRSQKNGEPVIAVGMAEYGGEATVDAVFARADQQMYANKHELKGACGVRFPASHEPFVAQLAGRRPN